MPEIAYVLKGFPRRSEIFIASEIHRLEEAGLTLRLFVIKSPDETEVHPVVARLRTVPQYLPPTSPLSDTPLPRWLAENLRPFLRPLARVARRRPGGLARAAALSLAQAVRARRTFWSAPRKLYAKEFLLAVALADGLLDAPRARHLHGHFAHGATTVAWLAATITGRSFSFTGHAKDIYSPTLNPAGLLRRKLVAARFAVTCTEANRRHLQAIAPDADVHCVYHGLNTDFTRLVAAGNGKAPTNGALRALGVGRLVPKKGFDVLVDACAILARRGMPVEARIVGEEGEHGDELRTRIATLGLNEQVSLPGPMSQSELHEEYSRATAFCLPCRILDDGDRDGIPNVLAEAMACGVPVVTTGVSGIPELVEHGVNGLLIPGDDPEALANALTRLHEDRGLSRALGESARSTVRERFDGDALAGRMAALFREALA